MPERLADPPRVVWRKTLTGQALAGLAATPDVVLVADRDPLDKLDIFRCLNANTGAELWAVRDLASGHLDYGNSPRASPLVHGEFVYFYNAFSRLQCVRLATGQVVWKKSLHREFNVTDDTPWGTSSSPLLVDDLLIVNPGAPGAAVVALRPATGEVVWQTPGDKAAFSSFVVGTLGGRRQLIGYQRTTLCGFDVATGQQLWQLKPPRANDFNVPTPIVVGDKLLVTTENNGTRLYQFDAMGRIVPQPVAVNEDLAPDAHTPVVVGNRVFGVWGGLHCLDLAAGLRPLWTSDDAAFNDYATAIASDRRVLIVTMHGELILLDAAAEQFSPLSRVPLFADDPGVYSHPALVGTRMFVRGSREIICVELGEGEK